MGRRPELTGGGLIHSAGGWIGDYAEPGIVPTMPTPGLCRVTPHSLVELDVGAILLGIAFLLPNHRSREESLDERSCRKIVGLVA